MPDSSDLWYIRFPDGRVVRAANTGIVRQQLAAGRLPAGTRVRRTPGDEWRRLEHYPEFAANGTALLTGPERRDGQPATIASRLDPALMPLAGVRSLVEELRAALDSALVRSKLLAAGLAGLVLGALAALAALPGFDFGTQPPGLGWILPPIALLTTCWLAVVLARMTYAELSRLRPARLSDALAGCVGPTVNLFVAQGLLAFLFGGLIFGLRWLPGWLLTAGNEQTTEVFAVVAVVMAVLGIVLEAVLWCGLVLLLPLGALVAIEQGSFIKALGLWGRLVRQRRGPLLLAEGLALGFALVVAVPLALLAAGLLSRGVPAEHALATELTLRVLLGLLGSVVLAYLLVANVFIYLHLRYER
jgi:hypothetical protein